jgi:hypothetical protein
MKFDLKKLAGKAKGFVDIAVEGLEIIATATGNAAVDKAADVLMIVKAVLASLENLYEGKVEPNVVRAEFAKLRSSLTANDAAADAALINKFGKKSKKPS